VLFVPAENLGQLGSDAPHLAYSLNCLLLEKHAKYSILSKPGLLQKARALDAIYFFGDQPCIRECPTNPAFALQQNLPRAIAQVAFRV
jgi:hypothetical protein